MCVCPLMTHSPKVVNVKVDVLHLVELNIEIMF